MSDWQVYLIICADDSLYCGITTDLERRLRQHNGELSGGARYTQQRRPVRIAYHERCDSRSQASQREYAIKQLSRSAKLALCHSSSTLQN